MKLLPDTQVLLCAITDCPRIEGVRIEGVRKRLLAQDNEVFFSVASLWKIVIKVSLGKLQADAGQVRPAASPGLAGCHTRPTSPCVEHRKAASAQGVLMPC